ncbi:hypothetical protein PANDA_011847 [Ailuropoda melanoleuca]|uniref:Uncharacterized protein n=1 Tax=Ailuropoda melanoleuca TaxID=9646 RepID=D2HKE6_AILME|nr:hypothetical protein PANDA_011847 [Ailuropoda melanoleuca]
MGAGISIQVNKKPVPDIAAEMPAFRTLTIWKHAQTCTGKHTGLVHVFVERQKSLCATKKGVGHEKSANFLWALGYALTTPEFTGLKSLSPVSALEPKEHQCHTPRLDCGLVAGSPLPLFIAGEEDDLDVSVESRFEWWVKLNNSGGGRDECEHSLGPCVRITVRAGTVCRPLWRRKASTSAVPPPPAISGTGNPTKRRSFQSSKGRENSNNVEENIKTEEPSREESGLEIDTEGVIEPDADAPQEPGDESIEITEEMMDQANDKETFRTQWKPITQAVNPAECEKPFLPVRGSLECGPQD